MEKAMKLQEEQYKAELKKRDEAILEEKKKRNV